MTLTLLLCNRDVKTNHTVGVSVSTELIHIKKKIKQSCEYSLIKTSYKDTHTCDRK